MILTIFRHVGTGFFTNCIIGTNDNQINPEYTPGVKIKMYVKLKFLNSPLYLLFRKIYFNTKLILDLYQIHVV